MSARKLSRRRALQVAGAAAVPAALLTCNPALSSGATQEKQETTKASSGKQSEMPLGAFSISLAVKDLKASREFYEKLGFKSFAGEPAHNWQILKNGDHVIGLFQEMFDKNIMTFNPGWDQNAQKLDEFIDVREIQSRLKKQGIKMLTEADEKTTGPASFTIADPDGNMILFDQHV